MISFGCAPDPLGYGGWPDVLAMLIPALERGGGDQVELENLLDGGQAQLWLAFNGFRPFAAMVTRKDGDTLEVWLAGGRVMRGCVPFLEITLQAAREAKMTMGRLTGRKGWGRVLRPYGWVRRGDDLVKDLA